jgi:tetratricopeptide (TPR) repeat protein
MSAPRASRSGSGHGGLAGVGRSKARKSEALPSSAFDTAASSSDEVKKTAPADPLVMLDPPVPAPGRSWIPMRKIWEPSARIQVGDQPLKGGSHEARASALAAVQANPLSRDALKQLYIADLLAGNLQQARETAERWSLKDPLDPDALTARADVAAQLGDNALAIRILGSVVDMRPDDHKAQWRLARLHRWQGQPRLGCRYSSAVAQMRPSDSALVSLALRCARDTGNSQLFDDLFAMAPENTRAKLDRALAETLVEDQLSGEFRLEANWDGASQDLDLVIVHPDGYRVSWLGAPTRAIISARDVLSTSREGLALKGAKPGSYGIELVRHASASGSVRGEVKLRVGKQVQTLPFTLVGSRLRIARVDLSMKSRLVPVNR